MSGGHFDYYQWHIRDIAYSIEDYIYGHSLDEEDIEYYIKDHWLEKEEKEYIIKNKHTIPILFLKYFIIEVSLGLLI